MFDVDDAGVPFESEWPALLANYDRPIPRYTSYPPVPAWSGGRPEARARIEGEARSAGTAAMYVHVPFCPSLCYYCACNRCITKDQVLVDRYLDAVEGELEQVARRARGLRLAVLHWGGGTPNSLQPSQMSRLFEAIASRFQIDDSAEISIEIDPRLASQAQIAHLGRLGFNRLSAGVQDFNAQTQAAIHRTQSIAQTAAAIGWARDARIGNINIDLIYGLPHQRRATFAQTVSEVQRLAPETVAMYAYAHVPWVNHAQRAYEKSLPSQLEKFGMLVDATRSFAAAGYEQIGIDHFAARNSDLARAARSGSLQRSFMGYTRVRAETLVGIGASAISSSFDAFAQNRSDVVEYIASARTGDLTARGCLLGDEDRVRRRIISDIMTSGVVRADERILADLAIDGFDGVIADGLAVLDMNGLRLTKLGRLFARNVAVCFDAYAQGQRRQASAV